MYRGRKSKGVEIMGHKIEEQEVGAYEHLLVDAIVAQEGSGKPGEEKLSSVIDQVTKVVKPGSILGTIYSIFKPRRIPYLIGLSTKIIVSILNEILGHEWKEAIAERYKKK